MDKQYPVAERIYRIATISTLIFLAGWGLAMVVAEIRPFWVDEWRIIYNLKFKDPKGLWGPLDYMQQFPRVYISIVKSISAYFHYSYTSLRAPSYVVGTALIVLAYRLMARLYPADHLNRYLFVMIFVSGCTFTNYYVQIKQYSMDLFLCLVAIWQMLELLQLQDASTVNKVKYATLCLSFLVVPYFSYTYPLSIAPVYAVLFLQCLGGRQLNKTGSQKLQTLVLQWLPLVLCTFSIAVFYIIDVAQLMADDDMHRFWGHLMMKDGFKWESFFINFYMLFAEVGAGVVFWLLFGILGIASFLYGCYDALLLLRMRNYNQAQLMRLFSVITLVMVILLFAAGKYPLGEPRLNAFTIPSISVLLIFALDQLSTLKTGRKIAMTISAILFAGVTGNIYTTCLAAYEQPKYGRLMTTYTNTNAAITIAQQQNMPILVTPDVAYPYEKTANLPYNDNVPGDWVLKTYPAYDVNKCIPVYPITDTNSIQETIHMLPASNTQIMMIYGTGYRILERAVMQ
jgi:hypothetical protein